MSTRLSSVAHISADDLVPADSDNEQAGRSIVSQASSSKASISEQDTAEGAVFKKIFLQRAAEGAWSGIKSFASRSATRVAEAGIVLFHSIKQVPSSVSSFAYSFTPKGTQLYRLDKDLAHYESAKIADDQNSPGYKVYDGAIQPLTTLKGNKDSTAVEIARARADVSEKIAIYLDAITFFTTNFSLKERVLGTRILGTCLSNQKDVKEKVSSPKTSLSPENKIFSSRERITFSKYKLNPYTATFPYGDVSIPVARGESLGRKGLESIKKSPTGPISVVIKSQESIKAALSHEESIKAALSHEANGNEWARAQIMINDTEVKLENSDGDNNITKFKEAIKKLTRKTPPDPEQKDPSDLELLQLFALISKNGRVSGLGSGTDFDQGINPGTSSQKTDKERDIVTLTMVNGKIKIDYQAPDAYVSKLFIPLLGVNFSIACDQGGSGDNIEKLGTDAPKFLAYRNWSCAYTPPEETDSNEKKMSIKDRFEMLHSYQGYELDSNAMADR